MVGYGFELLEYCRRERFPGGLWDQLTLDFGLVTLLSIVIYLQAQAARPLAIIACFSEFVLVDWTFMMFTLHHYVMAQECAASAAQDMFFIACVGCQKKRQHSTLPPLLLTKG